MGAVAKKKDNLPAAYDYGVHGEAGFEGMDGSELAIPFIRILQAQSPAVMENNPEGARAGMFYNTVTKEITDGKVGMVFQPCYREHKYTEWVPRDNGGGFAGVHEVDSEIVRRAIVANGGNKMGKVKTPTGNDLVETFYLYGNVLEEANGELLGFGVISFASTTIKHYRSWVTAMQMLRGSKGIPLYAFQARLKTFLDKNDKGQFYNFTIEPATGKNWRDTLIRPDSTLLAAGAELYNMVSEGAAKAAYDTQEQGGGSTSGGGGDSEVPF